MNIFVSYSSKDRDRVRELVRDLEEVGYNVWFDQELSGGQAWWDRILDQIRTCDVFLIALSENWVMSGPCAQECGYAEALSRHMLPVSIETLSPETLPAAVQRLQIVHYQPSDLAALKKLLLAFNQLPPPAPLPDPLPAAPPVPISPLALLADQLQAADLSPADQRDILTRLRLNLEESPTDRELLVLLERLIRHPACGDELVSEAQTLYEIYQPRRAAPITSAFARLTPGNAAQITRLGKLSYFVVGDLTGGVSVFTNTIAFSRDGQLLAASYNEHHQPLASDFRAPLDALFDNIPTTRHKGKILVFDTVSHKHLAELKRPDERSAQHLSFSPDRRLLAATYGDEIAIWDLTLRRIVHSLLLPEGVSAGALDFSPDGRLLAAQVEGKKDARLSLWDTQTGEPRADLALSAGKDGLQHRAFYFMPDGHRVLLLVKGEIHEASLRTFKTQRFAPSPEAQLQGLAPVTPGGWPVLIPAGKPARVRVFQPDPWQAQGEFVVKVEGVVTEGGLLPVGNFLARKNTVQRTVDDLAISPDGALLAILTDQTSNLRSTTTVTLWDPARKRQKTPTCSLKSGLHAKHLAFSPDGGLLAIHGWDKQVELWGIAPE